ncbi:MAG: hypothetical protein AAF747_02510 [Planctomycetota bacterium]
MDDRQPKLMPGLRRQRGLRRARGGFSFLETILASLLLALVAAAMASAIGFANNMQRRQDARLGAAEVANRLILEYLLDKRILADKPLKVPFGDDTYRWEISRVQLGLQPSVRVAEGIKELRSSGNQQDDLLQSQLERVTVSVWLSEDSGGAMTPEEGTPVVTLTRLVNNTNWNRNPQGLKVIADNPEIVIQQMFNQNRDTLGTSRSGN